MDIISPSFVLSALLATAYGAAFHIAFGGKIVRLALYLAAAWLGFALGQWAGSAMHVTVLDIGQVHTLTASLGSWLALATAYALAGRRSG